MRLPFTPTETCEVANILTMKVSSRWKHKPSLDKGTSQTLLYRSISLFHYGKFGEHWPCAIHAPNLEAPSLHLLPLHLSLPCTLNCFISILYSSSLWLTATSGQAARRTILGGLHLSVQSLQICHDEFSAFHHQTHLPSRSGSGVRLVSRLTKPGLTLDSRLPTVQTQRCTSTSSSWATIA